MAKSRRWALLAGLAASVLLVPFALFNRGQPIVLDFGPWEWRGEAVIAVYGGIFVGLLAMFLLGLPADLAARGERQRLARRVRELEHDRQADRPRPPETPFGLARQATGEERAPGTTPERD